MEESPLSFVPSLLSGQALRLSSNQKRNLWFQSDLGLGRICGYQDLVFVCLSIDS